MITTKITVEKHLAEYAIGKWESDFCAPVRFPTNSDLYITVYDLTQRRPENVYRDNGNLEIILPSRGECKEYDFRKNPEVYNYLSERSCKILNRKISLQFWAELHELLDHEKHVNGNQHINTIYTFKCKYRIESISEDCILKNFYRWRENLRKKTKRGYKKK